MTLSHLLLRVWNHNIRCAANCRASLNRCIRNRNVTEVVLADCLEGVGVWTMRLTDGSFPMHCTSHTNSTNESKKCQSRHDVPGEVRLARTVEGGCRAVLLVVVRRLGHAAHRISARSFEKHMHEHSPSDRHLEGCIWNYRYLSMSHEVRMSNGL